MTPAGKRRQRIAVQEHKGNVVDGEPTYNRDSDWKDVLVALPAAYQDVTGGEVVRGQQMEATTTGLAVVLSTPRTRVIHPKMRLRMQGRVLNIVNVLDREGDERELWIQVEEVASKRA